jgi:hypothetical protein
MTLTTPRRARLVRLGIAAAVGAGGLLAAPAPASATTSPYVVVADHLANPRGLFIPKGSETLYFSEAGFGGGNARVGIRAGTGQTGRVSVVPDADDHHPRVHRLASHLWSGAREEEGLVATLGPAGLTKKGRSLYVVISEAFQKGLGPQPQEGRLLKITRSGIHAVADIATASIKWESTRLGLNDQFPDTNPYGVTVYRHHGRSTLYVIDAGANTVSRVGRHGHLTVVSYLPNTPKADAIPTCIAQGPDGALYVTTLALVDGPGAAKIYRIDPSKHRSVFHSAKVWATGLTAMNGCAFSPGGKYFYVSELVATETLKGAPQGLPPAAVVKIPFAHPNSGRTYLGLSFLHFAGGVAVDRDGHVYVANFTAQGPGAPLGQVLRLKQ